MTSVRFKRQNTEDFKGIVTWVAKEWKSYVPRWKKNGQPEWFRKFYLKIDDTSIECVAWKRSYWPETDEQGYETLKPGRHVTVTGIKKQGKFGPQIAIRNVEVGEFFRELKTFTFQSEQIIFHEGFIRVKSQDPWVAGAVLDENSSPSFEKLRRNAPTVMGEEGASIPITATIEANARVCSFREGVPTGWVIDPDSKATITEKGWDELEKAAMANEEARKWRAYIRELKAKLQEKILSEEEIKDLADKHNVEVSEEALVSVIFKPEYEQEYYDYLKERSSKVLYQDDAFIFILKNGKIVWEKPKIGAATYIFGAQDIQTLTARLGTHNIRTELRSKDKVAAQEMKLEKFVVHRDIEQWTRDIQV